MSDTMQAYRTSYVVEELQRLIDQYSRKSIKAAKCGDATLEAECNRMETVLRSALWSLNK